MNFKKPFIIKDKHHEDFLRQLFYWRSLYHRKKTQKSVEHVSLKKLQKTLTKSSWMPLIHVAASVYFDRDSRGNSITQVVSSWKRKKVIHMNSQVKRLLNKMHFENIESVNEMWNICREKTEVEVTVTTRIVFKDEDVAILVEELMKAAELAAA